MIRKWALVGIFMFVHCGGSRSSDIYPLEQCTPPKESVDSRPRNPHRGIDVEVITIIPQPGSIPTIMVRSAAIDRSGGIASE